MGLAIDQMRWDYLYYYYDQYGEGGLKRLLKEGFSCENNMINYIPTVTAIGHASIYTGSVPALHGIAGNNFRLGNKMVYSCADPTVQSVGSNSKAGMMSPRNMWATTIGDMLKMATDAKSKVIGVALKDRASILPAGHAADAAYWWDKSVQGYITSTYYMKELPAWVEKFNKANRPAKDVDILGIPDGVTSTFKMAEATIENEQMGMRGQTDMLCVSVSSTDIIGHTYGTRGKENHAVYMRLDRDLAEFFNYLDKKIGRGNYLFFLSADHAGAHNPNVLRRNHIPAGGWDYKATMAALNNHLQQKFGVGNLFNDIYSTAMYLNHDATQKAGLDEKAVKAEAVDFLKADSQFVYVADLDNIASAPINEVVRERAINGYCRGRSGELLVIQRPNMLPYKVSDDYIGTSHSAWNPYDAHIPLVFMGWNVKPGQTSTPTYITDIAPTICQMLHIQMPDACVGNAILKVVE
uniref:Alkaline phosphatase family protein n=1 Tax=Prevotella sp. GTC17262 TaxID=3236797 RepID=A0AB33JM53_9BACT